MIPEDFDTLDIARYELRLRALQPACLPPFLGSTLRGAFGHSLKQAVCVMPHRDCTRCMVADRCIYPYLFETPSPEGIPQLRGQQQAPHPFILSPPPPGDAILRSVAARVAEHAEPASTGLPVANRANPIQRIPVLRKPAPPGSASLEGFKDLSPSPAPLVASGLELPVTAPLSERRRWTTYGSYEFGRERRSDFSGDRGLNLRPRDEIAFGLVLMGRAIEYLPYLVYAVMEMSRRGLGADRAQFELAQVLLIDSGGEKQRIYSSDSQRITTPANSAIGLNDLIRARLDELRSNGSMKVRFVTPTRIRVDGELQAGMSFELLVRNLLRRVSLLCAVHGGSQLELDYRGLIERARSVKTVSSRLRWSDWERYSNRQQTKMKLGGFMGEIEFESRATQEFLPLIVAGELLNVGTGTSFGLGRNQIVERPWPDCNDQDIDRQGRAGLPLLVTSSPTVR